VKLLLFSGINYGISVLRFFGEPYPEEGSDIAVEDYQLGLTVSTY
jgi:hypothetical protein